MCIRDRVSGERCKCYYVTQVSKRPIRFRLFCNSEERLEDAYQRFLVKGVHESFDHAGVPLFLDIVGKFISVELKESTNLKTGKKTLTPALLFPRYHQLDAVEALLDASQIEALLNFVWVTGHEG